MLAQHSRPYDCSHANLVSHHSSSLCQAASHLTPVLLLFPLLRMHPFITSLSPGKLLLTLQNPFQL